MPARRAFALAFVVLVVGLAPRVASAQLSDAEKEEMASLCEEQKPGCDPIALLGDLERNALKTAMLRRGRERDPLPWGKRLRNVEVVNLRVFGEREGFLQFFNYFHVTSREDVVRREVLLAPGQIWDQSLIDESRRKLRDRALTLLAVIIPVTTGEADTVDALVVTRDIWSLRFNFNAQVQGDKLSFLTFSLSENNFLGWRKTLAAVYQMDLGAVGVGPLYIDRNVLGRRFTLQARVQALFERQALLADQSFRSEGSESSIEFNRPLWSLSSKWGYGVEWSHRFATERSFQQAGLRVYDNPDTEAVEEVPWLYRQRRFQLATGVTRGFGDRIKHRLKGGHILDLARARLPDDFVGDETLAAAFERDVLPRSERASSLYVGYEAFTPVYREIRNVASFDLAEDVRLGPSLEALVASAMRAIGSERNFIRLQLATGYRLPVGRDGFVGATASISSRLEGGGFIDNRFGLQLKAVGPSLRWMRVVAEARLSSLWNETQNRFVSLGGDNGLRGFGINSFDGTRLGVLQVEARTRSLPILFTKWGGVAFYEVGGAGASFRTMGLHHDAGIGLRVLIPQTSSEVIRFDLAFPLDGTSRGSPRFTAGFGASF